MLSLIAFRWDKEMLHTKFPCLVVLVPLLFASCSSETGPKGPPTPKTTKVGGVLMFDGEPAPVGQVELKLYEKGHDPTPGQMIPKCVVGVDGKYEFSSYGGKDGAVPGEYVLSIEWLKMSMTGLAGPDKLLNNFNSPSNEDPRFQVTVVDGPPVEIPTIDIDTRNLKPQKSHPFASPPGKRKRK